jgi:hypothetical protein
VDGPEACRVALLAAAPLGLGRLRRAGLGLLRRGAGEARREGAGGEACQGRGGRRRGGEVPGRGLRAGARRRQGVPPEAPRLRGPHQVPTRRRRRPGAPFLPAVQPVGLVVLLLSLSRQSSVLTGLTSAEQQARASPALDFHMLPVSLSLITFCKVASRC